MEGIPLSAIHLTYNQFVILKKMDHPDKSQSEIPKNSFSEIIP
jgi:hypothetical protein